MAYLSCHLWLVIEQNPQSARRNNSPGGQISRWFLLLSEDLSASNYPGAATRCPFRKSCASMFWARQGVQSWPGAPHVALSLLYAKDMDHACTYGVPGIPRS